MNYDPVSKFTPLQLYDDPSLEKSWREKWVSLSNPAFFEQMKRIYGMPDSPQKRLGVKIMEQLLALRNKESLPPNADNISLAHVSDINEQQLDRENDKMERDQYVPNDTWKAKAAVSMPSGVLGQLGKVKGSQFYGFVDKSGYDDIGKKYKKPVMNQRGKKQVQNRMGTFISNARVVNTQTLRYMKNHMDVMSLYPHWIQNQIQNKIKTNKLSAYQSINANLGLKPQQVRDYDKIKPYYIQNSKGILQKNPDLGGRWKDIENSMKNIGGSEKKLAQARWIAAHRLTEAQVIQNVPPIVRQIITYNRQVSQYGIGPISKSGLPLYAGRWVDPYTQRIRILPKAEGKFLNPISLHQKQAYHMARILNLWNNIVSEQQNINKLSSYTPNEYAQEQRAKIQRTFDVKADMQSNVKKIQKYYIDFKLPVEDVDQCPKSVVQLFILTGSDELEDLLRDKTKNDKQYLEDLTTYWDTWFAQAYGLYKTLGTDSQQKFVRARQTSLKLTSQYISTIKKGLLLSLKTKIDSNLDTAARLKLEQKIESLATYLDSQSSKFSRLNVGSRQKVLQQAQSISESIMGGPSIQSEQDVNKISTNLANSLNDRQLERKPEITLKKPLDGAKKKRMENNVITLKKRYNLRSGPRRIETKGGYIFNQNVMDQLIADRNNDQQIKQIQ